jgi:hypothetical protein
MLQFLINEMSCLFWHGMGIHVDEGWFVLAKTLWFSPTCNVTIGEALGCYTLFVGYMNYH